MKKLLETSERYKGTAVVLGLYAVVARASHVLLYTIVTSFVIMAHKEGAEFSNTVNEIAGQYVFLAYAAGLGLLCLTLRLGDKSLYQDRPFWNEPHRPLWSLERATKQELFRGLSSGAAIAMVFLLILTLTGEVHYNGIILTSTLGTPVFPLFFSDLVSLAAYVVCDEYIFRHKVLALLAGTNRPRLAVLLTSFAYIILKNFQLQLSWLDILNLLLLNWTVGFFYLNSGRVHRGLGFLAMLYGLLHSVAGLPLWSQSSPSIFLFKASSKASEWLSGASAGPLASLSITSILLLFAAGSYISWKRNAPVSG